MNIVLALVGLLVIYFCYKVWSYYNLGHGASGGVFTKIAVGRDIQTIQDDAEAQYRRDVTKNKV